MHTQDADALLEATEAYLRANGSLFAPLEIAKAVRAAAKFLFLSRNRYRGDSFDEISKMENAVMLELVRRHS